MTLVYLTTGVSLLLFLVTILLSVAFMILFERKVLSYIQVRKGPNKVSFMGIIQSFGDAIKLFIKEQGFPSFSNILLYYFSPVLSLGLMILVWLAIPLGSGLLSFGMSFMFIFCCLSLGVYVLMSSGWSSNSNYALLGAIRGVAQTISYEVSLIFLLLSSIFLVQSLVVTDFCGYQEISWFVITLFPLFLCWMLVMVAETNRTPFDFAEGESELVSGFNIEYGSGGFALLFLAEYGMIIFMSYLVSCLFFGGLDTFFYMNMKGLFFCFFFLWVRGTLPRFRYDKLMNLVWKGILPFSLNMLLMFMGLSLLFSS